MRLCLSFFGARVQIKFSCFVPYAIVFFPLYSLFFGVSVSFFSARVVIIFLFLFLIVCFYFYIFFFVFGASVSVLFWCPCTNKVFLFCSLCYSIFSSFFFVFGASVSVLFWCPCTNKIFLFCSLCYSIFCFFFLCFWCVCVCPFLVPLYK